MNDITEFFDDREKGRHSIVSDSSKHLSDSQVIGVVWNDELILEHASLSIDSIPVLNEIQRKKERFVMTHAMLFARRMLPVIGDVEHLHRELIHHPVWTVDRDV